MLSLRCFSHLYLLAALLPAFVAMPLAAPAQGPTGFIEGVVRDEQGGVLPGVTLTLRNQDTGVTRTIVTESDGRYAFPALPPGRYTVRSELAGFVGGEAADVVINIGLGRRLDLTMRLQGLAETVNVTGEAPVVDTTKAEVAGVVTRQQIETLPINSRQYLSLALLVPGTTVDGTRSFFATVNVGGSVTFNGTGNVVDGMINNWAEDGEPRQDLPEDAVEEFKVTNASYKAEFGLATGGVVQTVTKSGTNVLRGTLFEYFRDKALNAKGLFESEKPAYRRHQFGGSAGGPVMRDRLHFFGAFERTDTDEFYTVRTGLPQFYGALEGTFLLPSYRNLYSVRGDWQISNSQSAFARFLGEDEKKGCQGCGGTSASGRDESIPRRSVVAGHTWIRGAHHLNDFRFQYAYAAFYGYPSGTSTWSKTGEFPDERLRRSSRGYRFPSFSYGNSYDYISPERRWGFRDTYSLSRGDHTFKVGGEYNYNPYVSEDALNLARAGGTYTFTFDQPFDPNNPAAIAALTGASNYSATSDPTTVSHPTHYYVGFVQDDWRLLSNLTVNLGLRYERLYGNANEDLDVNQFPVSLPFVDVSERGDWNNFGPRTGFAWDVGSDGATVVRGAYGIYYGHIRLLGTLPELLNFKTFSITINNPVYPDPFGGRDPREFIVSSPSPNITVVANDMVQPLAHQVSAGVSRRITETLALHVDAVYNRTKGDYKVLDINPRDPVTRVRPRTDFGRIDQVRPDADVRYRAVYAKLEKRFSRSHQFMVSYTYTNSEDNNPMARFLDPFDLSINDGPSNGERRHGVVASGSVLLPWEVTVGTLWTYRSQLPWSATAGRDLNGDGFTSDLVPATTRNSGSRNLNLAAVNEYRAANGLAAIAEGQIESSRVNMVDLRVSKQIPLGSHRRADLMLQVFNLLNADNLQAQFGSGRVTNALSANFGRILSARPATQVELAVRFNW
ncbi:MAG: carboxypeptidase regulatory-like domain-containing protein [Vicinamibacterales bacterium]